MATARVSVRDALSEPLLDVMNVLNEVVLRYPDAISFAPGRPLGEFFEVHDAIRGAESFARRLARESGLDPAAAPELLGQYGPTAGLIRGLIAQQLARDEGITVSPESIVVTVGCQEAMTILLLALFEPGRDALLVSDPTYIGITGMARILGIDVVPVPQTSEGLTPDGVREGLGAARERGLRPQAVYDVPDFNNPAGTSIPLATRRALLELVEEEAVLFFEDNPYGMFAYDGPRLPTLKSLDQTGNVVYLGSFSKTVFPGIRVGFVAADIETEAGDGRLLAAELATVKSLTTVNTSPICQSIVGAILQKYDCSLGPLMREKLPRYRANRDAMLASLDRELRGSGVRWNRPAGGFFISLELPFRFDTQAMQRCARDFGVICCPFGFFSVDGLHDHRVRLSFSYVDADEISEGIRRFARFVAAETST